MRSEKTWYVSCKISTTLLTIIMEFAKIKAAEQTYHV